MRFSIAAVNNRVSAMACPRRYHCLARNPELSTELCLPRARMSLSKILACRPYAETPEDMPVMMLFKMVR